jgi:hypothetical protein
VYKLQKIILPILLAAIWISVSEFIRNELFLKSYWIDHYENIGLVFPSEPINGIIWGIWSLCFAIAIYIISKRFSITQTTFISWFVGFILMWIVVGNMGVFPFKILYFALPLSILETFLAVWIIVKLTDTTKQ